MRRKLADILADMAQPVPDGFIESKTARGIRFIPVHNYIYLLNKIAGAGNWRWEILSVTPYRGNGKEGEKSQIVICGRLTIYSSDSEPLSMDGLGCEDGIVDSYGDPSSNAEAQAIRRAARMFGLGLHLWREDPTGDRPLSSREKALKDMVEGLDPGAEWEAVVAGFLPKGWTLADLNEQQFGMLATVLKASLHPELGDAMRQAWDKRQLVRVKDRYEFVMELRKRHGDKLSLKDILGD